MTVRSESPTAVLRSVRGFCEALAFLTVVPVARPVERAATDHGPRGGGEPTIWFPAVGFMIGSAVAAARLLPVEDSVAAALALTVWVAVPGGLHEDAWSDCCDAAFAPVSRERRVEILRDPHIGAHALTGSVLLLLARFTLLTVVNPWAVVGAATFARASMTWTLAAFPSLRSEGLAVRFGAGVRPGLAGLLGMGLLLPVGFALGWIELLGGVVFGTIAAIGVARFLARRFGGLNGDGHGATGIAVETAVLVGVHLTSRLLLPVSVGVAG